MGELVPRQQLVKQAMVGVGGIGGGIILLALGGVGFWPGIIIGGLIGIVGLAMAASKKDKGAGLIVAGGGIVYALSRLPFLKPIAGFLLGAGGIALIAVGAYSAYKFIKNLNARR
ncbi:MAG: hypothetical protein JW881_00885 [Spirochaetales bacterium]|nr:hypothetical protein [Spirochaetales bacterium]